MQAFGDMAKSAGAAKKRAKGACSQCGTLSQCLRFSSIYVFVPNIVLRQPRIGL